MQTERIRKDLIKLIRQNPDICSNWTNEKFIPNDLSSMLKMMKYINQKLQDKNGVKTVKEG